jgi:hypothetical protein
VPCRLKLTIDDYFVLSDAGALAERGAPSSSMERSS